jgi:radical SAM superfamily enzyme YgiQ (UPF0313 family)
MPLVLEDVKKLINKYGMSYLEISNATVSPRQLKEFSQGVIREGLTFSWRSFARLDEGFTPEVLTLAKEAGCESILFGLESASQRVLDFIQKGIKIETAERIIADCRRTGINVIMQMMLGLPSETVGEALETIGFLIEHRADIHHATFNAYYLTPACEVYRDPARYGVLLRRNPELPFTFFQDFSHINGELDTQKAEEFINLYHKLLAKKLGKGSPSPQQEHSQRYNQRYQLSLEVGQDLSSAIYSFDPQTKTGNLLEPAEVANV